MKKRSTAARAGLGIVVLAVVAIMVKNALSGSSMPASKAYYTDDDGATQFVDSMDHFAPFDHNGKPAYRAWVFSTDGGKTTFVGYLERYTPEAKARLASELEEFKAGKTHMPPDVRPADSEVKKPGPANPWVSRADIQKAQQVTKLNVPANVQLEIQLPS